MCAAPFILSAEQSPVTMPQMPAPPSVEMPSVSAPVTGGFYAPGKIYGIPKPPVPPKASSPAVSPAQTAGSVPAAANALLPSAQAADAGSADYLSAADIQSLGQNGLLGGVYNLLGSGAAAKSQTADASTTLLLQNILTEIEGLKKQLAKETTGAAKLPPAQTARAAAAKSSRPAILRFTVNGSDILSSCQTVYFSKPEADGTFLLTADRKYFADGKQNAETFYFLFKSDGSGGAETSYAVIPEIMQSPENPSSPVVRLSRQENLTASKTGNLVSLRASFDGLTADLLLDIGKND
ncbi:MAG: hypothetical protein ACTTKL_05665 [Treponema sp.]